MLYEQLWENLSHKGINIPFVVSKFPHSADPMPQGTDFPRNYYWKGFPGQLIKNLNHAEVNVRLLEPKSPQLIGGTVQVTEDIPSSYFHSYVNLSSDADVIFAHTANTGNYYWQGSQGQIREPSRVKSEVIFHEPKSPQLIGRVVRGTEDVLSPYFRSYMNLLSDADAEIGTYYWKNFPGQIVNPDHVEANAIFQESESLQLVDEAAEIKRNIRGSYLLCTSITSLSGVDVVLTHAETGTATTDFAQFRKSQIEKQNLEISKQFGILSQREDNWDGRGSQKPTDLTLAHAKEVMSALLNSVISAGYECDTSSISIDGDGNVTAAWYKGERQLHFQIGEHEAEYFRVWGTNIDTEMDVDFLKSENYLTLWKWLIDGLPFPLDISSTFHLSPVMETAM